MLCVFFRIEVSVTASDNVKWDGVGLPVADDFPFSVTMLAEMAGGIKTHGDRKKSSDEVKLLTNAKKIVDANNLYSKDGTGRVFCLLYHGKFFLIYNSTFFSLYRCLTAVINIILP